MLHIAKSGNRLVGDTEEQKSTQKEKDPLAFDKWMLHNGQPVHEDDRRIFVATEGYYSYYVKKH